MDQKRAVAGVVAVTALLAATRAQAQKSPLAQAAYARAQQQLAASRFKEAAGEMETAVRYEPRFAMGWYVLASSQRRAGRCDEAVAAYRRYMELRPTEPDPYFGAGLCLQSVGDVEGATAAFQHYVQADTKPASRQFVATARQHLIELERARPKVATSAPPPGLTEARQLRDRRRSEDAVARYRSVIAADPKSADAHAELGAVLVSLRRPDEAVSELRAAVHLAPAEAPAWYNLAFALRQSGQATAAVAAYRRYITFKPKDPDPHYGLGRALASLGRDQEALSSFRTYAVLETRITERQWLKKARLEIARLEGKLAASPPPSTPSTSPSSPPSSARSSSAGSLSASGPVGPASPRSTPAVETAPARQPR